MGFKEVRVDVSIVYLRLLKEIVAEARHLRDKTRTPLFILQVGFAHQVLREVVLLHND